MDGVGTVRDAGRPRARRTASGSGPPGERMPPRASGVQLTVKALVFAICCVADAFVLRPAWTGRQIADGQFRRGYFERFGDSVGLAMDNDVRPDVLPMFLLTDGGELAVPPGMTAVMPLAPAAAYDLTVESPLAPYVVIGAPAPVAADANNRRPIPGGDARLVGGRTLSLQDGHLALVAWDPLRPWREDAGRLSILRGHCAAPGAGLTLTVSSSAGQLEVRLGRCSLAEPLPSVGTVPLLAALAGPEWVTATPRPGWSAERWVRWPVLAVVVAKVAAMWWGVGLTSAAAVSAALGMAAFRMPVPAVLTWVGIFILTILVAILRGAVIVLRQLPSLWRAATALAVLTLVACVLLIKATQPKPPPEIVRTRPQQGEPDACAIVGYSTARGQGLRHNDGGIRWLLDGSCAPCRRKTAGLFSAGETMAWARTAYCASPSSLGALGHVVFLGGANDDYEWGMLSLAGVVTVARLFIAGQQGIEPWRHSYAPAAAASLARMDAQTSALEGLLECVRSRRARFLFLHDFMIFDMVGGREPDRAAMLARRRATVEAAGGTFIDLLQVFDPEAGIAWFNDCVHLSIIAHERVADLACQQLS